MCEMVCIWFLFLIFRWVQAECRRLGDSDNPEVGELLKTAVRCLKERPVLFNYCAEEVNLDQGLIMVNNLEQWIVLTHTFLNHTGGKYET